MYRNIRPNDSAKWTAGQCEAGSCNHFYFAHLPYHRYMTGRLSLFALEKMSINYSQGLIWLELVNTARRHWCKKVQCSARPNPANNNKLQCNHYRAMTGYLIRSGRVYMLTSSRAIVISIPLAVKQSQLPLLRAIRTTRQKFRCGVTLILYTTMSQHNCADVGVEFFYEALSVRA